MAQRAKVAQLKPAEDDALDAKRTALYLAAKWDGDVAHTYGLGWFVSGIGGLWNHDQNGVTVRNRIRRAVMAQFEICKG